MVGWALILLCQYNLSPDMNLWWTLMIGAFDFRVEPAANEGFLKGRIGCCASWYLLESRVRPGQGAHERAWFSFTG